MDPRGGRPGGSLSVRGAVVWLLLAASGPLGGEESRESGVGGLTREPEAEVAECPLYRLPVSAARRIPAEEALARVGAIAAANRAEIGQLDARWRAGEFGPPGSREAKDAVRRLALSRLKNWYSFMVSLSSEDEVRALEGATIEQISSRYADSTVFPAPRLRHVLVGRGWVCGRYDLGGPDEEGATVLGGRRSRYSVREITVDGHSRRLLAFEWSSSGVGRLDILLAEHYGFRLERRTLTDGEGPYDLYLARNVSGAWVRRFGVHRPAGFAFWATSRAEEGARDGSGLRVGAVLYLPHLRLRLPLLPDIGLDDLRILDPPVPLLPVEEVRRGNLPEWLPGVGAADLADWDHIGSPPPALATLFPDL
jgi:hypothetical protein